MTYSFSFSNALFVGLDQYNGYQSESEFHKVSDATATWLTNLLQRTTQLAALRCAIVRAVRHHHTIIASATSAKHGSGTTSTYPGLTHTAPSPTALLTTSRTEYVPTVWYA